MAHDITSEDEFAEILKGNKYVLVDFWAAWCGPCRMLAPVLDQVSKKYEGSVKFIKVNVDSFPSLARQFNVMGIPTLILFESGQPKDKAVGALPPDALDQFISRNITS